MNRLKLASILGLFAGPFIMVMNFIETNERKTIDREGIEVSAVPISKMERRGRKGGRTYKLEVEFPVKSGRKQTAQVEISRDLYDHAEDQPLLKIKYLEHQPAQVIVVGQPLGKPELTYVGLAVLLAGLGGTWWYFLRKRPEALPAPAEA